MTLFLVKSDQVLVTVNESRLVGKLGEENSM